MTSSGWTRDDGYSGCKTKYYCDYAMVILEDEGEGWGFQIFDEDDLEAVEHGEYCYSMEGIWSEEAAMRIAEMWASEQF